MVKASIVIPTYNRADFIQQTIQSVLDQTYKDFEIIIIDDGSKDNTKQIVEDCIKKTPDKISYFFQENKGVSAARNFGIDKSKGEFIVFLDSDDVLLPNCFELQRKAFDENPYTGLVYGKRSLIDKEGNIIKKDFSNKKFKSGYIFDDLLFGSCMVPCTVMVKRDCLKTVGYYDESISGGEDWELYLRICKKYPVIFIDSVIANYRYHGNNSIFDSEKMFNNILQILNKHKGWFNDKIHKSHFYNEYGWELLQKGNIKKGEELILRSLILQPEQLISQDTYRKWIFNCIPFEDRTIKLVLSKLEDSMQQIIKIINKFYAIKINYNSKKKAYATMAKVMGLYFYLARDFYNARKCYLSALRAYPIVLIEKEALFTMAKSLFPEKLFKLIKVTK